MREEGKGVRESKQKRLTKTETLSWFGNLCRTESCFSKNCSNYLADLKRGPKKHTNTIRLKKLCLCIRNGGAGSSIGKSVSRRNELAESSGRIIKDSKNNWTNDSTCDWTND